MASSISVDFVTHCEQFRKQTDSLTCPDDDLPWRCPCLQVMDIQLYGGLPEAGESSSSSAASGAAYPAGSSISRACGRDKGTQRYYVALHDTRKMLWAVAPPLGALATMIDNGDVEIGSLVTLGEYAIVEAANRRRLVVVLAASCAVAMPFSMIGQPFVDGHLYKLSSNSLIAKQQAMVREEQRREQRRARSLGSGLEGNTQALIQQQQAQMQALARLNKVLLDALWAHHAMLTTFDAIHTWHVRVRVLWKSKLRRIVGTGGADGTQAMLTQGGGGDGEAAPNGRSSGGGGKLVFDAIVCDEDGDAVKAVFLGRKAYEVIQQGKCYRIGGGSVHLQARAANGAAAGNKRGRNAYGDVAEDDDEGAQTELVPIFVQFHEKTWLEEDGELEGQQQSGAADQSNPPQPPAPLRPIPSRPHRLLSGAEEDFLEVKALLHTASIGDLVSFRGIISKCGQITDLHTRNGRVDKLAMTVKDRSSGECIDVTLWGSVALSMAPFLPMRLGTTWCFRDVTVRMYGNMKTISSRSSSEVLLMSAMSHILPIGGGGGAARAGHSQLPPALAARLRQQQQEVSLTYAGTQFPSRMATSANLLPQQSAAAGEEDGDNPAVLPAVPSTAQPPPPPKLYPFQVTLPSQAGPSAPTPMDPAPILAKIQHLAGPFVVPSCRHCGRKVDLFGGGAGSNSSSNTASRVNTQHTNLLHTPTLGTAPPSVTAGAASTPPTADPYSYIAALNAAAPNTGPANGAVRCTACGKVSANGPEPRYAITMLLTDGIRAVEATAYGEAAASLCGEELGAFVANCHAYGAEAYTKDLIANLLCLPVLVGMTRIGGGGAEPTYHITVLQHVDMGACAQVMAEMLADMSA